MRLTTLSIINGLRRVVNLMEQELGAQYAEHLETLDRYLERLVEA